MIIGAHSIIYSKNAEADRAFLRDIIGLTHVDVGGGWLIFGLPPSEVAVHPGQNNGAHEFYLMCEDIEAFVRDMRARGRACSEVQMMGWGALTEITLPGGSKLGVYQPRHARPKAMELKMSKARPKKASKRKAVKRVATKKKPSKRPRAKARRR